MNRPTSLERLKNEAFDICIIGAGASGAGCALDAALRGYKVALIDKSDFASETSSRSTKLIHGGVRYLEQAFKKLDFAQLKQVRHGLEERHIVLKNAPHLARPLPLLTPVDSWIEGLYYKIGLQIYDTFAVNDSLPKSRWLNKKEVLDKIPTLDPRKLHSGVLYYDGQLDDARYCLAIAQSASELGAAVANYVEVKGFKKSESGKIGSVLVSDIISGDTFEINTKLVINCTGPFSDTIRQLANPALEPRLRPSKGVHIMLPAAALKSEYAMLIPKTSDGRVVFAIPFEGAVMVGTTDTDYVQVEKEPTLNNNERIYLANTLNPYLAKPVKMEDIQSGFGGLRPLLAADPTKSTKSLVRDHEVETDEKSGLMSLLGGKWTTYRLMAKDTVDQADQFFSQTNACKTDAHTLAGGEGYHADLWKDLKAEFDLSEEVSRHFASKYGSRSRQFADLFAQSPELKEPLSSKYPYLKAEAIYAARFEMAVSLRDFFARRIRLEITDWQETLHVTTKVADLMAQELGWSNEQKNREEASYKSLVSGFISSAQS